MYSCSRLVYRIEEDSLDNMIMMLVEYMETDSDSVDILRSGRERL